MRASKCPRCGAEMTGGVCDNCGFPLVGKVKKRIVARQCTKSWKLTFTV